MLNGIRISGKEINLLAVNSGRDQIVPFAYVTCMCVEGNVKCVPLQKEQRVTVNLCKKGASLCWKWEQGGTQNRNLKIHIL
jgi:hypothetical protein